MGTEGDQWLPENRLSVGEQLEEGSLALLTYPRECGRDNDMNIAAILVPKMRAINNKELAS